MTKRLINPLSFPFLTPKWCVMEEKDLKKEYELYACLQCGKCVGGCPISSKSKLNTRKLMREVLLHDISENLKEKNEIWECTSCSTCTERCPRGLEPSKLIRALRSYMIEEGHITKTIIEALESAYKQGNPFNMPKQKRADWAEGMSIKKASESDTLYYVGCAASYDDRVKSVAISLSKCLEKAGINYGILGTEEVCCGSEIRRLGEEGLFEELSEKLKASFEKYGIKKIITTSPHCYNTFKNEYNLEGIEVFHYSQIIAKALEEGTLKPEKELKKRVTYHDPCYLGKVNKVFDEPRTILKKIPGIDFVEFDRSREKSMCCEGGGGRMWVEPEANATRLSEVRVRDALDMGAEIIAVSCPFCLLTLEDAVKTADLEEKIKVKDITELLVEIL